MNGNKPDVEGMQGCTDHSCIFGHPGGMGTNGGCHCLEAIRPLDLRRRIMHNIHLLRAEIRRLRAAAHPAAQVAGDRLPTSIAQFIMRAQHLLIEEQEKPNPDNALVGFLCDAVRLARENSKLATAPLVPPG